MIVLLCIAIVGLTGATIFLAMALLAARRFVKTVTPSRAEAACAGDRERPGVSILKPLYGAEPRLRENLESFFRLPYPKFEIVFGAREANDPALRVVHDLRQQYPGVAVAVVLVGEPDRPNAKVCALAKMVNEAAHDLLVISDSDVQVESDYLHAVMQPFTDPEVGLVTCMYRGVSAGGPWSRLEAMAMSTGMTSGVLIADMLEGMKFALGSTVATRKDVLRELGGIGRLAQYCSDDYLLGHWVAERGWRVVLSRHIVSHVAVNRSLRDSVLHQVRWMKSTRCSRPLGHIGSGMTYAMPFGVLGFIAGLAGGHPRLGLCILALAFANRVVQALAIGWGVVRDRASLRWCWAYPAHDLMGFALWAWSLVGDATIIWRGQRYRLLRGGEMTPADMLSVVPDIAEGPAPQPQAAEVSQ